jgi:chorismate dehydratase
MKTVRVGFIPYLNMVPFHQGFGPQPFDRDGVAYEFPVYSPRALGIAAAQSQVDAGAFSLVDCFRLSEQFEPIHPFGIGVKRAAQSVLLFSRVPLNQLKGVCAVTDETATSVRLLHMLLEDRYGEKGVTYGRIPSSLLFDGDADSLLLIGDDALRAKKDGIKGLPIMTDLGEEWFLWKGTPFVFARWMMRKSLPKNVKEELYRSINSSLSSTTLNNSEVHNRNYWQGFVYRLTSAHEASINAFEVWMASHV